MASTSGTLHQPHRAKTGVIRLVTHDDKPASSSYKAGGLRWNLKYHEYGCRAVFTANLEPALATGRWRAVPVLSRYAVTKSRKGAIVPKNDLPFRKVASQPVRKDGQRSVPKPSAKCFKTAISNTSYCGISTTSWPNRACTWCRRYPFRLRICRAARPSRRMMGSASAALFRPFPITRPRFSVIVPAGLFLHFEKLSRNPSRIVESHLTFGVASHCGRYSEKHHRRRRGRRIGPGAFSDASIRSVSRRRLRELVSVELWIKREGWGDKQGNRPLSQQRREHPGISTAQRTPHEYFNLRWQQNLQQ